MDETIVIIGVFDVKGSTNIPMAQSFVRLGFRVIPINYRTVIHQKGMNFFVGLLMHTVEKYKPLLTIFCKCNGVSPEIISLCNKYSRTWLFNPDINSPPLERWPEITEHAVRATFSSCTGGDDAEYFKSKGANCFHIIQGVDPDVFKSVAPNDKYRTDISFIGTKTKERDYFKQLLDKAGIENRFYGNGYGNEVLEDEFSKVCSSSRFMLSLNTYSNIFKRSFSNRLMRLLACAVCTFHYDNTETLNDIFEDGKEIVYIRTPEELISKINSLTDEESKRIAIAGRDKVLNNYTWDHVSRKILDIIGDADGNSSFGGSERG